LKSYHKKKTVDCLGMGIVPLDLLFYVNKYPQAGQKIDADNFYMQGGGPVPNVLIGLSRMGYKTALIAAVGDDLFGKIGIEELKKEGVDHRLVMVKNKPSAKGMYSLLATGWIENKTGRRTMVLSRKIFVKPSDIILSKLPLPKIIHLDGRDMPATMKLARWGKRVGALVSFDIGSMRNDVSEVFPFVDHLVVAENYAFPFTKTKNVKKAIKKLATMCPGTIIITEGIKGSTGWNSQEQKFFFQPAFKVKDIDTTGAGDCYHTGYLYGLLKGYRLAKRMELGSAAAALKCTKPGARSGIPTERELLRFLKSNPQTYNW